MHKAVTSQNGQIIGGLPLLVSQDPELGGWIWDLDETLLSVGLQLCW